MFLSNSRYSTVATYTVRNARGTTVTACRFPVRPRPPVRGHHTRGDGQRLDGIAAHYLGDPTAFWRLCDAADALVPDALAARERVPVPAKER